MVRENANGTMGSFEAPVIVPELKQAPVKVSSIVLSTQIQQQAGRARSDNPLTRDGVERAGLDAPDRRAAIFRLEVPAQAFKPGFYTCQVNIIDAAAGKFAFPRLALLVR